MQTPCIMAVITPITLQYVGWGALKHSKSIVILIRTFFIVVPVEPTPTDLFCPIKRDVTPVIPFVTWFILKHFFTCSNLRLGFTGTTRLETHKCHQDNHCNINHLFHLLCALKSAQGVASNSFVFLIELKLLNETRKLVYLLQICS